MADVEPPRLEDLVEEAARDWALDEFKKIGDRYFQLAQFFFSASVGAFAVIPFWGEVGRKLDFSRLIDFVPLALMGLATLISILMTFPVSFRMSAKENFLIRKHRAYSRRMQALAGLWFLFWVAGVGVLFAMQGAYLKTIETTG
jgi:hypothetical protein